MNHPSPSSAASSVWESDIRALEERHRLAFLNADIAALDQLWVDDLIVNSPLNQVHGKQRVLDLLRAGRIRHTAFDTGIEQLTRHGDTVVVMGHDRVVDPPDGIVSHRRFTNIWRLEGQAWRVIARHAGVISRDPPP